MNNEQAFAMIEQAKERELTDEECDELGAWAEAAKAEPITSKENARSTVALGGSNSLVEWITKFTKETRPSAFFSPNFTKVSKTVMPHVVAVFEKKTSKR